MKIVSATIGAAAMLMATTSRSEDRTAQISDALFENMSISYVCKKSVGDAHYLAARTMSKDILSALVGNRQAIRYVDQIDQKLKSDPRVEKMNVDPTKCYSMMSVAKHRIEVEQAKHSN